MFLSYRCRLFLRGVTWFWISGIMAFEFSLFTFLNSSIDNLRCELRRLDGFCKRVSVVKQVIQI